jgi:hypothetical protein
MDQQSTTNNRNIMPRKPDEYWVRRKEQCNAKPRPVYNVEKSCIAAKTA